KNWVHLDGAQVYETYKKEAAAFWKAEGNAPFLMGEKANRRDFSSLGGLWSDEKNLIMLTRIDRDLYEVALKFDAKTGWVTDWKKLRRVSDDYNSIAGFTTATYRARAKYESLHKNEKSTIWLKPQKTGPK